MTQKEINALCEDLGHGKTSLEMAAMANTKQYLSRIFCKEGEIDPAYAAIVAGSYYDGTLDTIKDWNKTRSSHNVN